MIVTEGHTTVTTMIVHDCDQIQFVAIDLDYDPGSKIPCVTVCIFIYFFWGGAGRGEAHMHSHVLMQK